jgi:RNA polymerase sigma-70 factor (ECF subfamily)
MAVPICEANTIDGIKASLEPTDEALAARVAARDLAAYGQLYDRHVQAVYALASHLLGRGEAEEAVQEVFLRLWNRAALFSPSRGSLRTWLLSIARHYFLDRLRRRNLEHRVQLATNLGNLIEATASYEDDVSERTWRQDRARAVRAALMDIPEEQRRVLYLSYFAGLSQSAIARELNTPLGTVKKRAQLGMRKLRSCLENLSLFQEEREAEQKGGALNEL